MAAATQQLQAQRQQAEAFRAPRLQALDQKLESLSAKFDDTAVALEHDAKRLGDQYQIRENPSAELDSIPLPCLGPRAHWMDCQKKYPDDPRPCDAYATALQKCCTKEDIRQ